MKYEFETFFLSQKLLDCWKHGIMSALMVGYFLTEDVKRGMRQLDGESMIT